ncbi:MAG: hypothetical protein Q9219_002634 [cf. Caloplaca sp. 3 TL-2023]
MSFDPSIKIILGAGTIGDSTKSALARFDHVEDVKALLDAFHTRGYKHIDTARDYAPDAPGSSEPRLAAAGAVSRFTIDTKVHSGTPGDHEPSKVTLSIGESLAALETSSVETMYLHLPDRQTPFEDAAGAINKSIQVGKAKKFGLSNYTAAEVQEIVDICEKNGFAKPSVYQGHYNAIVRGGEKELFPVLRKHNIAFYAYSVLDGKYGDGVIFGVSKIEQLHQTLDALEAGPLPADLAAAITAVYTTVQGTEPPYHM